MACSLATATVTASADDHCRAEGCYSVAWPDYGDTISSRSDVAVLMETGNLSAVEAEIIAALAVRRQALRIRGLELRYLVGKTATSEGEGTAKLDQIRHQVESIEEEIGYIDRELSEHLDAYGQRTGPWLVVLIGEACADYWFVPRHPCDTSQDVSLRSATQPHWLEAAAKDGSVPDVDLPGVCLPTYVGFSCPPPDRGDSLTLTLDGRLMRFYRGD